MALWLLAAQLDCLSCHSMALRVEGKTYWVDSSRWRESPHFREGFSCSQCHGDITRIPHRPKAERDSLAALGLLPQAKACSDCHGEGPIAGLAKGPHRDLRCTDCHDPHGVDNMREGACLRCHRNPVGLHRDHLRYARRHLTQTKCQACHGDRHGDEALVSWRGKLARVAPITPKREDFPLPVHATSREATLPCEACHSPGLYGETPPQNPLGSGVRWWWIDWAGLPLLGLTLLGLLGHGALRALGRRHKG